MDIKVGKDAIAEASKQLSNWGRWGEDDEIGTLNYVTPKHVREAAKLVKQGKVFGMGIPLNQQGPQSGLFGGRWNPIHTMLATGTDAIAGCQDETNKMRYSDDAINMPVQSATHWDSLGHIFYQDKMYNGHDARNVDSRGVHKLGIEHTRDRMVGRGVLLDVARFKGVESLDDGYGISNDELDAVAKKQGVTIQEADFVIIRTGHMERCIKNKVWGNYAGGDAPGDELHQRRVVEDQPLTRVGAAVAFLVLAPKRVNDLSGVGLAGDSGRVVRHGDESPRKPPEGVRG